MREDNDDSSENLNETDDEIAESEKEVEESQATKIVNFIRNKWKLPVPELIISITGGAQHFKFASPRVRNAFQKGLISAAMNTDAWIFTAGTHSGIIKEVGDAFDKCRYKNANAFLKLPCIGICSWFATTDYKQLESPSTYSEEDKSKISEQPNTIDKVNIEKSSERSEQNVRLYRVRQPPEKGEPESYPLDHNHTHFIILQDEFGEGDRKWKSKFKENVRADLILPIRAQIEQESRTIKRQGQKYKIPIVQILVDGGVSSILTVCESIAAGTPVIVIAVRYFTYDSALMTDSEQRQKSKKLVLAMAWKKYDLVAHDVIKNLMESDNAELHLDEPLWEALRRNSVNFVELLIGYGASFERLRRLINTSDLYKDLNDNSSGSSLHLPDITQQVQPSNHTPGNNYGIISHPRKEDSFLHGMVFFNANDIIRESGHVTELSINFANLAASESLPEIVLYILSSTNDKNKFLIIYRRAKQYLQITKIIVENDIRTLIIQEPTLFLQTGQYLAIGFRNTISRPFQVKGSDSYYIDFHAVDAGLDSGRPTLFVRQAIYGLAFCFKITPATGFIRDLFLWSLFVNRSNLATCLCSRSENTIVAAMLACKIYQTAARSINESEKKAEYESKESEFDDHAAGIINKCFEKDEEFAVTILTSTSKQYFYYSPLQLAKESNGRKFLATKCMHKYLDKQWFGNINKHQYSSVWITILFRLYYIEKRSCNIDWAPQKYFTMDKWNILDLAAIFLYLAGFIPRWIPTEAAFTTSKVLMCIDLFLWYIRILHLFIASERLGTKLLMIFNTIKDLLFFICFVLIFLIGYSVASYSLITTNEQVFWNSGTQKNSTHTYELKQDGHGIWSWTIIRNVIDWGMWKVYGQVSILSNTQVDGSVLNGMIKHELLVSADELHIRVLLVDNGVYGTTVFILTILFVCIANVLLLNVLVALFNVTLKKVKDNAHMSWAFHRFLLVNEYARKSPFPPPFNLFEYGWRYINYLKSNKQLLNNNLHGSLDDSSGLDSNMYNIISFNAMDRVRMGGIVNQVFINFSTAPSTDDPDIRLFVIMDPTSASNSNWFRIVHHEHLVTKDPDLNIAGPTTAPKIKKEKGIQKFDTNIKINEGQYLAIRFSPKDGNPYSTIRNQYYVNYEDLPHANMSLLFTSCSTKGIAMSFNVKTAEDSYNKRCTLAPCCANNEQPPSYRNNVSGSIERNEFQSRDDMLREESIAQEYWATVIKGIKRSEKNENDQYKFETNNPKQLLEVTNHWADQKVEITI
ncbi:unnamed protein product [Rotaria socialis]|uniref:Uncharacterized protein n=1 Tax=Rotaria socialis TaxID=392032 RepID=A0A818SZQ0_9BILA|nr:unnamed protein product [Rotaria socialis]